MATLEKLTLNGAVSLLTYLQYDGLQDESVGATALVATLCEMLTQIEALYPGITDIYGWQKIASPKESVPFPSSDVSRIDAGHTVFDVTRIS